MKSNALATAIVAAIASLALVGSDAQAQGFDKDQLKCRSALAKGGAKLAGAIGKAVTTCHKLRSSGKGIMPSADCNDIATADTKMLVSKAETALRDASGGAKDKCTGVSPAAIGWDACPAPCSGDVPTIADMSDVADCLICLVRDESVSTYETTLGMPSAPLGGIEAKCHSTVGKVASKHLATVVKMRSKCQGKAEKKDAVTTTDDCAAETSTAIDKSADKLGLLITKSCVAATIADLDSCSGGSLTTLQNCVRDDATTAGQNTFLYLYGDQPAGALTWTEIQSIFATTCSGSPCHTGIGNSGGLTDLESYADGYTELVGAPEECGSATYSTRVVPGDPAASFLMAKLDHTQDCGDEMPLLLPQLDLATRNGIRAWIASGAPMN